MDKPISPLAYDEEAALAARAAWLHFAGGKTQGEVAELLGLPNSKTHRLIARARHDGLIRVFVDGPIGGCIELEDELREGFGLVQCEVVPNIDEGVLPLHTLGTAGARYIRTIIEHEIYPIIGFGHGRTLSAAVDMLPAIRTNSTKFVSVLGGLTRRFAASPFEVIHRVAEKTGAEAYVMPVPFFANTAHDKRVLEQQAGVSDVIAMAKKADIYIAGIGEVDSKSFIASTGMVDKEDSAELVKSGIAAELLGQFFRADGTHVPNAVSDRALAPGIDDLRSHKIVALAGGTAKTDAVCAMLASGLLHGLITDEATARRLVAKIPGQAPGKKNGKAVTG